MTYKIKNGNRIVLDFVPEFTVEEGIKLTLTNRWETETYDPIIRTKLIKGQSEYFIDMRGFIATEDIVKLEVVKCEVVTATQK